MQELRREVYLGRISRGKADFRVTLIIEVNQHYPDYGLPVRLFLKYAGNEYYIAEKISWFVGDAITPVSQEIQNAIHSIYMLHELYMSYRATAFTGNTLTSVVIQELQEKRKYSIKETEEFIQKRFGGDGNTACKPPEIPDSTLQWLFGLPGAGCTYEDFTKVSLVSDEDYLNIISTAG